MWCILRSLFLGVLVATVITSGSAGVPPASAQATGAAVGVEGNRLVDAAGEPLQLAGLNRSGSEYACAQGWGIFDGPVDAAAIALMKTWRINAVRVPLNEHCWLSRNGVDAAYAGERYRAAIRGFVDRLEAAGLVAILELHWSAAGDTLALRQAPMPNTDHSVDFWSSVAREFRGAPGVVFELFNEPYGVSWSCWRDGCAMPGGWRAAGMQQLLDAVRGAGATQPVVATGLRWGNDLSEWLEHRPRDPAGALAAGFHVYSFNACMTAACWQSTVAPIAERFPLLATEVGEDGCRSEFTVGFMRWADERGISFLPWTWNDWAGCAGPALIAGYDGTPTTYGVGVRAYLQGRTAPLGTLGAGPLTRLAGPTRVDTAAAVSAATFPPGVDVAFVAREDVHPDALAAGPHAAAAGGPVLLVSRAGVPAATRSELERLRPGRILVLGGEAAISAGVADSLAPLAAGGVTRIGGASRYDTAVRLSRTYAAADAPAAFVASGESFPDALAGGAAAAAAGAPLLLTARDDLPAAVLEELARLRPRRLVVLGGAAAVSEAVGERLRREVGLPVERLAGADRYETAAHIAASFAGRGTRVFVSTGEKFPDALAGVPAAGVAGDPIVLVRPDDLPAAAGRLLTDLEPRSAVMLGGEQAVGAVVEQRVRSLLQR